MIDNKINSYITTGLWLNKLKTTLNYYTLVFPTYNHWHCQQWTVLFHAVNEILLHWFLSSSFVVGSSLLSLIRRVSSFKKDSSSLKQTQRQKNVTIRLRNDLSFFSFRSFLTLLFSVSFFFSSCRDFGFKSFITFFVLETFFFFSFCFFDFFLPFLSSVAWHWLSRVY